MPKKLSKAATTASISTTSTEVSSSSPSIHLPRILTDTHPLPKLIVFDLDYTLWPFWVDTHVSPPLKTVPGSSNTATADKTGERFSFYSDVPRILHALPQAGIKIGIASRTSSPDLAREMLKLLHVHPPGAQEEGTGGGNHRKEKPRRALEFFDGGVEIYPSSKLRHFAALHKKTEIPYEEMLFFDDESRNKEVESLGVTMCLVRDGTTWAELERGIREWRTRRGFPTGETKMAARD